MLYRITRHTALTSAHRPRLIESTHTTTILTRRAARKIKRVGMKKALEISGIELEGPHHRALADVLNIGKLYANQNLSDRPNIFDAGPDPF